MNVLSFGRISLLALLSVPAAAADMPMKAPAVQAPPVAVYNWTGFYIGGHAGYGWGDAASHIDWSDPVFAGGPSPPAIPADYSKNTSGFIGGGQIGWNYQTGNLVVGVEADLSYANFKDDISLGGLLANFNGASFTYSESQRLRWFGTTRARIGFTPVSNWLIYATGGFAFGKVNAETHFDVYRQPRSYVGSVSWRRLYNEIGLDDWRRRRNRLVGSNWTAKLEYLYYDLGTVEVLGVQTPLLSTLVTVNDQDVRGHIVRLGLNYKFGGPLVAKY